MERAFPDLDLVCARGRAEEQPEGHSVSQDFDGLSTMMRGALNRGPLKIPVNSVSQDFDGLSSSSAGVLRRIAQTRTDNPALFQQTHQTYRGEWRRARRIQQRRLDNLAHKIH